MAETRYVHKESRELLGWDDEEAWDNSITYEEAEEQYGELLDEVYGDVSIAGFTYSTGYALRSLDPIAFRQGVLDNLDSDYDEIEDGV